MTVRQTSTATPPPKTIDGETHEGPSPVWLPFAWAALAGSLLPIGVNVGLPFQLSPADVLLPLMIPVALLGLPCPGLFRHLLLLTSMTLVIVLVWAVLEGDGGMAEIQSWLFFWKSWTALLLTYGLIHRSRDPQRSRVRVLNLVSWAQVILMLLIGLGWALEGELVVSAETAVGAGVTGFSAGSWDLPVQLYGYGQVNVTASLLAMAGPIMAYRSAHTSNIAFKVFWLAWIPASWWFIINSGSRGALLTAGLFMALIFLASDRGVRGVSVGKLALTVGLAVLVVTQADVILEASPKYTRTLQQLGQGNTDAVTSGRSEINALSLADIQRSPLVGTAFGDYQRFHTSRDTPWTDSSPHNSYLGPIHKMGIPLGLGYLWLLARALPWRGRRDLKGSEFLALPLVIPLAIGSFPVGDALTTPVLAATILTISGAMMRPHDSESDPT